MKKFYSFKNKGSLVLGMLSVLLLMIVVAFLLFPILNKSREKTRVLIEVTDISQVRVALSMYYEDHGTYPYGKNVDMVKSLNGKYLDFIPAVLNAKGEFLDPWANPYYYEFSEEMRASGRPYTLTSVRQIKEEQVVEVQEESEQEKISVKKEEPKTETPKQEISPQIPQEEPEQVEQEPIIETQEQPAVADNKKKIVTEPIIIENTNPGAASTDEPTEQQNDEPKQPDNKEEGPTTPPNEPQEEKEIIITGEIHAMPNDGFVVVTIDHLEKTLFAMDLLRKQDGSSEYTSVPIVWYYEQDESGKPGNDVYYGGDNIVIIEDNDVSNDVKYFYKSQLVFDEKEENKLYFTPEVFAIPEAIKGEILGNALAILNAYQTEIEDISNIFSCIQNIPIVWGYLEDANAFYDAAVGRIVLNAEATSGWSNEAIAAMITHEGNHVLWEKSSPPLPDPLPLDEHGNPITQRSFDSIDQEYNCFFVQSELWNVVKAEQENFELDFWISEDYGILILDEGGEERAKEIVRLLYTDLPEY